jgi:molybdate transport system permease protein
MKRRSSSSLRVLVALLTAIAVALFALPILAIVTSAPWSRLLEQLSSVPVQQALGLSLISSFGAVLLAVLLGLPLALWLSQSTSMLRTFVRIIVTLPIVLPPVTAGIALLKAYGRSGLVGAQLERWFGFSLPFSTAATVVAAAYMGMPFFVLSVETGLRALDPRLLDAAASLGAGPWRRLWSVTLPMIRPSLRTGILLCFARALGEYCATQMFAGNLPGTTRTLPLACAVAMEVDEGLAIGLSLILASLSIAVLFVLRHSWTPRR